MQAQNTTELSKSLTQPYSLQYSQTLPTGLSYYVNFSGAKSSETNSFASYNPSLTADLTFGVSQPLIRNRGSYVNRIPLMMAQSNLKVSDYNMRMQLIGLINNAENYYWNVVSARENLKVQEKARDTAAEYLKYMEKQLELGAISPLDIYNPQQSLAANDLSVSQARWSLTQAEDALRHQIGVDLDPNLRKLPMELTEPAELGPAEAISVDTEQEVAKALSINPAMKYAMQRLDVDDLGIQSSKNGLLPNLVFSAAYTANGRGGIFYPADSTIFGGSGLVATIPGGIADALSQMFGFGYPTYYAGLTLTLPIRSKTASANMAIAVVQKKTDALNVRNQEQAIRLNILTAVSSSGRRQGAVEAGPGAARFRAQEPGRGEPEISAGHGDQPERDQRPAGAGAVGIGRGFEPDRRAPQPAQPDHPDRRVAGSARHRSSVTLFPRRLHAKIVVAPPCRPPSLFSC